MRKKHYEAIADALRFIRPPVPSHPFRNYDDPEWTARDQWERTVDQVALALVTTNPTFDKARFLLACGR